MYIDDRTYYTDNKEISYSRENNKTNITAVEFNLWTESETRPREAVIKKTKKNENSVKEVEFLKKCNEIDENTAKYYYHYTDNTHIFIFMEFCKGGSLKNYIEEMKARSKRLGEADLIQIFNNISRILSKLHHHTVFHRDIKPDNIFITGGGIFKLGDMGESKDKKEEVNTIKGTLSYFSPHLYSLYDRHKLSKGAMRRFSDLNPEAEDNYSLGKTFLELIVLELYIDYHECNSAQIRANANMRLNRYGYSPRLNDIILDMLEDTKTTHNDIDDYLVRFQKLQDNDEIENKTIDMYDGIKDSESIKVVSGYSVPNKYISGDDKKISSELEEEKNSAIKSSCEWSIYNKYKSAENDTLNKYQSKELEEKKSGIDTMDEISLPNEYTPAENYHFDNLYSMKLEWKNTSYYASNISNNENK